MQRSSTGFTAQCMFVSSISKHCLFSTFPQLKIYSRVTMISKWEFWLALMNIHYSTQIEISVTIDNFARTPSWLYPIWVNHESQDFSIWILTYQFLILLLSPPRFFEVYIQKQRNAISEDLKYKDFLGEEGTLPAPLRKGTLTALGDQLGQDS